MGPGGSPGGGSLVCFEHRKPDPRNESFVLEFGFVGIISWGCDQGNVGLVFP